MTIRTLAVPSLTINQSILIVFNSMNLNRAFNSIVWSGCRYANGTHYLMERYHVNHPPYDDDLKFWMNFGLNFLFTGAMFFANIILHIIPLPAFVKTKFRGWATFSIHNYYRRGTPNFDSRLNERTNVPWLIIQLFCDHIMAFIVT